MEKKSTYVNFPVTLLRNTFNDLRGTINTIFHYVVYKHAQKDKKSDIIKRIKKSTEFFELHFDNMDLLIEEAEMILAGKKYDLNVGYVNLDIDILWDHYNNGKSEFDIACFCAYCAIKSIIGNKEYVKTNKSMIVSRMFGDSKSGNAKENHEMFSSLSEAVAYVNKLYAQDKTGKKPIHNIKKNDAGLWYLCEDSSERTLSDELRKKYSLRYHIDNVLTELQLNWGLKLYSDHSRGFYLSFTQSLEDLAVVNALSKKTKQSMLVEEKHSAKMAAIIRLNDV